MRENSGRKDLIRSAYVHVRNEREEIMIGAWLVVGDDGHWKRAGGCSTYRSGQGDEIERKTSDKGLRMADGRYGSGRMGRDLTEMNVKEWRTRESVLQRGHRGDLQRTDRSRRGILCLHRDHWLKKRVRYQGWQRHR